MSDEGTETNTSEVEVVDDGGGWYNTWRSRCPGSDDYAKAFTRVGLTPSDGKCLVALQSHYDFIVYLGFSLWRRLLMLLVMGPSVNATKDVQQEEELLALLRNPKDETNSLFQKKPREMGILGHMDKLPRDPSLPLEDAKNFNDFLRGLLRNDQSDVLYITLQLFHIDAKTHEIRLAFFVPKNLLLLLFEECRPTLRGNPPMATVKLLVEKLGIDVNATASAGGDPPLVLASLGSTDLVRYLLDHGATAGPSALKRVCQTKLTPQSAGTLRLLLERGAKVEEGNDLLHCVCRFPAVQNPDGKEMVAWCKKIITLLLDHGAEINEKSTTARGPFSDSGFTALHIAACEGYSIEVVQFLLQRGANPCLQDGQGKLPNSGHYGIRRVINCAIEEWTERASGN